MFHFHQMMDMHSTSYFDDGVFGSICMYTFRFSYRVPIYGKVHDEIG